MNNSLLTLRFNNWWSAKIPPLLSYAFAVLLLQGDDIRTSWLKLLMLLVWMIGAAAFGHYINDIFDIKDDLAAGKANQAAHHSGVRRTTVSTALLMVTLLPWLLLPKNPVNLILVAAHLVIFMLYSAPPVRLKERGVLAVFTDAVYAHVIPGLVVVLTLLDPATLRSHALFIGLFSLWQLLIGCRNILNHQIDDYENDLTSGTTTLATAFGNGPIKQLVKRLFFPLEVLVLLLVFHFLPLPFKHLVWFYLGYTAYTFYREVTFLKEKLTDKVIIKGRYDYLSGILLNEFYERWLPLIILLWLFRADPVYGIVLLVYAALFYKSIIAFRKDINFGVYLVYEIFRQSYFAVQKPVKHFFVSTLPAIRNMSYWKVRKFLVGTFNRIYWSIVLVLRKIYWAWIRLYRNHIVRIAWVVIKFYYRVEYKLWKTFYKPLKDKWRSDK